MVAWDGVIVWVQVFTSGVGSIPLDGSIVGAGCAWRWCGITAALIIGGFTIVASSSPRWPCHWEVTRNFVDAGLMDGGMHIWEWQILELKRGLMVIPWKIFLLCHVATVKVVQVVRPDLVFVMGRVGGNVNTQA